MLFCFSCPIFVVAFEFAPATSRFQLVVGRRDRTGTAQVRDHGAGPQRGDFAGALILIPTVAAAGLPNGAAHAAVNLFHEALLGFRADFDHALFAALHEFQALHRVARLGFDHQNNGIVAEAGVGPEEHKEIGESRDRDPEVRGHSLSPGVVNFHAAATDDTARDQRLGGAKAGAINQNVDAALYTILSDDAVLAHFRDGVGNELHIGAIEGWLEIVRHPHALAAQLIFGRQCFPHLRIFDPARHVAERDRFRLLSNRFIAEKTEDAKLLPPENVLPQSPTGKRDALEAALPLFAESKIEARHDPRRSALEKMDSSRARRDLRDELDGAGARAHDRDVLAFQLHAVIPGCGMKRGALETVEALEIRVARHVQGAHSGDQHARLDTRSILRTRVPHATRFVPDRFVKTRFHANMRGELIALDAVFQVIVNFLPAGIHA